MYIQLGHKVHEKFVKSIMFYGPPDEMRNEPLLKHRREATFLQHWQTEIRADALCLGHGVDSVSQTCNYLTQL